MSRYKTIQGAQRVLHVADVLESDRQRLSELLKAKDHMLTLPTEERARLNVHVGASEIPKDETLNRAQRRKSERQKGRR